MPATLLAMMHIKWDRRLGRGGPAVEPGAGRLGEEDPGVLGLCSGGSGFSSLCLCFCLFRVNFSHLAKRLLQVFQEERVQKYQASLATHGKRMR